MGLCGPVISPSWTLLRAPSTRCPPNIVLTYTNLRRGIPAFKLFVTGYAQPFNFDDSFCNTQSFIPWPNTPPLLSTELRKDIDDLATEMNAALSSAVADLAGTNGGRVLFADPGGKFDAHRFCENDESQFNTDTANGDPWL